MALHQIEHLSVLKSLFVEVHIPPAVAREAAPSLPDLPAWIIVREVTQAVGSEVLWAPLGQGESETLGLALEMKADVVFLDDRPARRLALRLGLPVVGTVGILVRAKRTGLIPAVRPLLTRLLDFAFRLSPTIRDRVLTDAGEGP